MNAQNTLLSEQQLKFVYDRLLDNSFMLNNSKLSCEQFVCNDCAFQYHNHCAKTSFNLNALNALKTRYPEVFV